MKFNFMLILAFTLACRLSLSL